MVCKKSRRKSMGMHMIRKLFNVCRCYMIRQFISRTEIASLEQVIIRTGLWKITRKFAFRSGHTSKKRYLVFSLLYTKTAVLGKHSCQI